MRRVYTALVTPFDGGKIDFDSLKMLIEMQNKSDTTGIVALGTTAESNLLSLREKVALLEFAKKHSQKQLIAAISSPCTKEAVLLAKRYQKIGVDALLVVTPYYVGCTNQGMVKHYEAVGKACNLPIILYNVPQRTGVDVAVDTTLKIGKRCNLWGVKECNDDANKLDLYSKHGIKVWCGNDCAIDKFEQFGLLDSISVVSNICPNLTVYGRGNKVLDNLAKLCATANPSVVKYALLCAGLIKSCQVRLPLTTPQKGVKKLVASFVKKNWESLR